MLADIFRRICSFMFFVFFLNGSVIVFATDYYIDSNNGDDENDGTSPDSPWKTLSKVSSMTFQPGDNIYFKRGTMYSGCAVIKGDGTKNNPITVSAYGSGDSLKFTNPNYNDHNGNAMQIRGDYIIVENLYFHHTAPAPHEPTYEEVWSVGALHVSLGSDHVIIRNNEFANIPKAIQSYSEYSLITNNYIHDNNNTQDNGFLGYPGWGPIGIQLGIGNQEVCYNVIENMYVAGGRWGADGGAIEIDDGRNHKNNIYIHHNITYHNMGFLEVSYWYDIKKMSSSNVIISYNVVRDYQTFLLWWAPTSNSIVRNNTVIRADNPNTPQGPWKGVFVLDDSTEINITKNIIVVDNNLKEKVFFDGEYGEGRFYVTHINNCYWNVDGGEVDLGVSWGTGEIEADPLFVDYANKDYHLQPNTPCPDWGAYPLLTGGFKGGNTRPEEFELRQNYPNPFNSSTTITFGIPVRATVQISIYNMLGQIVSYMDYKNLSPGIYSYTWDSRSIGGILAPSGVYFCELTSGNRFKDIKKMILLR